MTGVSSNFNSDPIAPRKKKSKKRRNEFEVNDSEYEDYSEFVDDSDSEPFSKKKAVRKKNEMFSEKKRLRDQDGDFDY